MRTAKRGKGRERDRQRERQRGGVRDTECKNEHMYIDTYIIRQIESKRKNEKEGGERQTRRGKEEGRKDSN